MFKEPHHLELTKDSLGADQALENIGQLLESHSLSVSGICDRPYHSEGTISNWSVGLII